MEGTPFGRYRLIELLGRGGMGEVWRAFDPVTNRVVALKMLSANLAEDPQFAERFRREALAAAGLTNPHVVPIHNFGEIEGRLYVDMALIDGRDLRSILADGPLPAGRAIAIIGQIASALHAAHRIGLVHRDVKPSNILVDDEDSAYLIDFGIARTVGEKGLTGTGNVIGTWAYMSPERLTSGQTDPRADIYALACVLHECLTGHQPFPGESLEQQITAHLTAPPPRPTALRHDLPAELDTVIATGMAKDPEHRYPTVTELAQAAREAITVPATQPPPITPPEPIRPTEPVRVAAPVYSQAPTVVAPLPPPPADGTKPRLGTGTKVAIGLVAVLVLAAAAATTAVVMRSGSQSNRSPANVPSSSEVSPTSISEPPPAPPVSSAPAPPASLTGNWSGPVSGDQSGFDVVADIVDGPTMTATVSYPQLNCTGTWTQRGSARNRVRFISETITHGTCVPSEITLTPQDDGTLYFTSVYYAASQQRNLTIHATMRRS